MTDIGVVRGRFQVFHLKHLEYVLAAKMRCRKLLIGIEEPDRIFRKEQNPFTYFERFEMIHDSLIDFGIRRDEFEIIPFPSDHPERILNYVPQGAEYYLNICDEEDEKLRNALEQRGFQTEVLIQKTYETRGVTSSEVRECILNGLEWRHLVPKKVYEYIMCYHLDERMIAYKKYLEEQTLFDAVEQLEEEEAYREEMESLEEMEVQEENVICEHEGQELKEQAFEEKESEEQVHADNQGHEEEYEEDQDEKHSLE